MEKDWVASRGEGRGPDFVRPLRHGFTRIHTDGKDGSLREGKEGGLILKDLWGTDGKDGSLREGKEGGLIL